MSHPTQPSPAFQPLGDRILVSTPPRPKPDEEQVIGGIVIPNNASQGIRSELEPRYLVVHALACGEKCTLVAPGQHLIVDRREFFTLSLDGAEHTFVREPQVIGTLPA